MCWLKLTEIVVIVGIALELASSGIELLYQVMFAAGRAPVT